MHITTPEFSANAKAALADEELQQALDKLRSGFTERRRTAVVRNAAPAPSASSSTRPSASAAKPISTIASSTRSRTHQSSSRRACRS